MAAAERVSYPTRYLREHYPIQRYDYIKREGKHLIAHFLIPSAQPDATICAWLKVCNEKYREFINRADDLKVVVANAAYRMSTVPALQLCPLDVAILSEREPVVETLCSSPHINSEVPDSRGWIPLQHAIARGHPGILARVEAVTRAAAERFPFLRSIVTSRPPADEAVVASFLDAEGRVKPLKQSEFQAMSRGARFYDGIMATPDALFRNWQDQVDPDKLAKYKMSERYEAFRAHPPTLLLSDEGQAGLGVRTNHPLRKGDIACLYGAELIDPADFDALSQSDYSYQGCTGENVRTFGSVINEGLPNVQQVPVIVDGVELGSTVCLRDIGEREQLLMNYGYSHVIKWAPRTELRMDAILQRFPHRDSLLKEWRKVRDVSEEDPFEYQCAKSELVYLLHTPSALLSLILRGHFDPDSLETLLKIPKVLKMALLDGGPGIAVHQIYFRTLRLIGQLPPDLGKEQRDYIATKFETSLRAGIFALTATINSLRQADWQGKFDRIAAGTEAFYSLVESRTLDKNGALKVFHSLPANEKAKIIDLYRQNLVPAFANSHEEIEQIIRQLEEKKE